MGLSGQDHRWSLTSGSNRQKRFSLGLEVETAIVLVKAGLAHLQRADTSTEFVTPVPLVLLSQGLERLAKCLLVFEVMDRDGRFPQPHEIPRTHDLKSLLNRVLTLFDEEYLARPAAREDFEFLTQDELPAVVVQAFSSLGDASVRYYYLDVVRGAVGQDAASAEEVWARVEREVFDQEFPSMFADDAPDDPDEVMKPVIVAAIERMVRALVRLFTLGRIASEASLETSDIGDFLYLKDEELGTRQYSL